MSNKPDNEQVGTLLYSMGDCADDILAVIKLDESRCTYLEALSALDLYFNSRKNTIFARAKLNRRVQQPGGSVDAFIQDLHKLADECSYMTLKEELIRDRIVVGVRDDDLSKTLQGKEDLDLSEAIRLSRQAEARLEGQNLLRPRVDLVHKSSPYDSDEIQESLYVIKGQQHALLSGSARSRLGLVARLYNVTPAKPDFVKEFPTLFKGLGKLSEPYSIKLRPGIQPMSIYTARKIAHPLLTKVKTEIDRMLAEGVICPVDGPTDWCSGIVVVPKPNDTVRICVDLTALNKAVLREVHPLRSVDEDLARLSGSTVFTKLDAKSGFWQMPLEPESRLLTTFLTPFGRFCMNLLPFGISSAPEIFQRRMTSILKNIDGVICHMDDILVHASTQQTHDDRVRAVLSRLREAGLTLKEKCEFSKGSVRFLGHIIDGQGILNFPAPANVPELQRFLGMVNQLAKFTPELASQTEPLRQLLKRDSLWSWDHPQKGAFKQIKQSLTSTPILAHYCMGRESIIAADASNAGLGAVLLQRQPDGSRRPVSYISRSLTAAEKNYAVIEKEALAATWASERFSEYILGAPFTIETDHKPLVPLLTTKELHKKSTLSAPSHALQPRGYSCFR